jgi:hypothetical protein
MAGLHIASSQTEIRDGQHIDELMDLLAGYVAASAPTTAGDAGKNQMLGDTSAGA